MANGDKRRAAAEQLRKAIQLFIATLSEDKAMEVPSVYPTWAAGTGYTTGDIISYGTNSLGDAQLYKVIQNHVSQADWTPDKTASLYSAFGLDEDGYVKWAQPAGAHDAYNIGDIVNYNGTLYKCVINGNVWSPDVYPDGWVKYNSETPPSGEEGEPETPTYPDFVQPTGSQDAYKKGDRVIYNGSIYESVIDNNVWSPDAFPAGWTKVEE